VTPPHSPFILGPWPCHPLLLWSYHCLSSFLSLSPATSGWSSIGCISHLPPPFPPLVTIFPSLMSWMSHLKVLSRLSQSSGFWRSLSHRYKGRDHSQLWGATCQLQVPQDSLSWTHPPHICSHGTGHSVLLWGLHVHHSPSSPTTIGSLASVSQMLPLQLRTEWWQIVAAQKHRAGTWEDSMPPPGPRPRTTHWPAPPWLRLPQDSQVPSSPSPLPSTSVAPGDAPWLGL
jgi:hypothetical protein